MVAFETLAELERAGTPAVLITVVDTRGSTPRKAGARMIWLAHGGVRGTVGGGAVEHQALEACPEVLRLGEPRFVEVKLGQELGMCCGGIMRLYLEPLITKVPFILLGAGHVAQAVSSLVAGLGFTVHVADGREEFPTEARFPVAQQRVDGLDPSDLDTLPFSPRAFVLIATHDHALDQKLVEACLRRETRWLGMIGSRRKALMTRQRCLHKGFASEELARLTSPVGLDLGSQTPEEIAVSIAAELVAIRRRGAVPSSGVARLGLALDQAQPVDLVDEEPAAPVPLLARDKG
jgi:xanthine dehydrogenase accessory factor